MGSSRYKYVFFARLSGDLKTRNQDKASLLFSFKSVLQVHYYNDYHATPQVHCSIRPPSPWSLWRAHPRLQKVTNKSVSFS